MTSSTSPPGKKPPVRSDDPWDRLARTARAAQSGDDEHDLGDTGQFLSGRGEGMHVTGTYQKNEMLELVTASLAATPDRADLWMMRFEALKSMGMRQEFVEGLVQGWKNAKVCRHLDWGVLLMMWSELAPGEPLPEIIKLPGAPATPPPRTIAVATPAGTARIRRFHDVALRVAERELAILGKAYAALCARPGFFEDFVRKIAPTLRRPTPLQFVEALSRTAGENVRIYLKREDRRSVTAEFDHAAGQCYIAQQLGRSTVITANDVDAHVLAVSEMAPKFNLKCVVVVAAGDLQAKADFIAQLRERQVQIETMPETGMLSSDPREGAVRLWQKAGGAAHLVLSLGTAPPPYPQMAATFQALLGRETELQFRAVAGAERPRTMVAAVESEADSLGFVLPQLGRKEIELVYAEPEPGGIESWRTSARLRAYNGAIREHTLLYGTGRIEHVALADSTAQAAREQLSHSEKIDISLEDARAVALTLLLAQRDKSPRDFVVLVA